MMEEVNRRPTAQRCWRRVIRSVIVGGTCTMFVIGPLLHVFVLLSDSDFAETLTPWRDHALTLLLILVVVCAVVDMMSYVKPLFVGTQATPSEDQE